MPAPTESPRVRRTREESREETRHRLIASATELFAAYGVPDTSLRSIAEHAGFSRGAVHANFSDKAELAEAVALDAISSIGTQMDALLTSSAPSGVRLESYIRRYLSFCTDQPLRTRALIAVVGFQSRFDTGRFTTRVEESLSGLVVLFEDGQRRGEMRSFDPWFMAFTLRSTLDAAAGRLATGTPPPSTGDAADELATLFTLATRTERP